MRVIIDELRTPIVLAPMAGGPSTPELAAAVSDTGGLGFLAAGYLGATDTGDRIASLRQLTRAPFGVNLFVAGVPTPPEQFANYLEHLGRTFPLGEARFDTDAWDEKLDLLTADPVAVVSCTFGCPSESEIARLHAAGSEVWVTVTSVTEARIAVEAGADVLIAQGAEAGGHRGGFTDQPEEDDTDPLATLALVQLLRSAVDTPIAAAGGIATGAGIAAVLAAGASAAQLGTAFLRCPEAGTSALHRDALEIEYPDHADPGIQWPPGPRPAEPIHPGQPRRTRGLPRNPLRHRPVAGAGTRRRQRRRGEPLGRSGPCSDRRDAGRRPGARTLGGNESRTAIGTFADNPVLLTMFFV